MILRCVQSENEQTELCDFSTKFTSSMLSQTRFFFTVIIFF